MLWLASRVRKKEFWWAIQRLILPHPTIKDGFIPTSSVRLGEIRVREQTVKKRNPFLSQRANTLAQRPFMFPLLMREEGEEEVTPSDP